MDTHALLLAIDEKAAKDDFVIDSKGQIRAANGQCPVCWLASKLGKNPNNARLRYWAVPELAHEDHLSPIAKAADEEEAPFRDTLLKVCKLT